MPQPLSYTVARSTVLEAIGAARRFPAVECVDLNDASGRVLAEPVSADRDYPPFDRSLRDGFALRAGDAPGALRIVGEVRAGGHFDGEIHGGEAVEIMTGAPLPAGADAVVMVEHVRVEDGMAQMGQPVAPGLNVGPRGSDALAGSAVLRAGQRIGFAEIAVLATVGVQQVNVFRRPRVAILTTGDEMPSGGAAPLPYQIRDSNSWSLAAQVRRAGGEPVVLSHAPDDVERTAELVAQGLTADLLLVAGGVSAGKYDVVEAALARHGAEFYFDRVLIQPGQPLVFGRAHDTFFFGLPGNPVSTMVCFELFARAAVELQGGQSHPFLPMTEAVLSAALEHRPGLTRFLPAMLSDDGALVTPVPWSGSGDVMAMARANAFLVAESGKPHYAAGERIRVLVR